MPAAAFPILKLPSGSCRQSLLCMDFPSLINFSLVSRRSKQCAVGLNLEVKELDLKVNRKVNVCVEREQLSQVLIEWKPNQVDLKHLLEHCMHIFHEHSVSTLMISDGLHDWRPIHTTLSSWECKSAILTSASDDTWFQKTIDRIPKVSFLPMPMETRNACRRIIACPRKDTVWFMPYTFSDLLSTSSERVSSMAPISAEDYNLFLRLWAHGSIPALKLLTLRVSRESSIDINDYFDKIFKNLDYSNQPDNAVRTIYKWDGTEASVKFDDVTLSLVTFRVH